MTKSARYDASGSWSSSASQSDRLGAELICGTTRRRSAGRQVVRVVFGVESLAGPGVVGGRSLLGGFGDRVGCLGDRVGVVDLGGETLLLPSALVFTVHRDHHVGRGV